MENQQQQECVAIVEAPAAATVTEVIQKECAPVTLTNVPQLNYFQRLYRFLKFGLLCSIIVFDIIFLVKTRDSYFEYFNVAVSFFLIPFILSLINNLRTISAARQEASAYNCFFGFFYKAFRLIGFEHFIINLYSAFMKTSTQILEDKLVLSNAYHAIYGSQILLWVQCHLLFRYMNDESKLYWYATPIILHACHLALLGAEIRQSNKSSSFISFAHTFFHIDFLSNIFEGIGRALMIGATAMAYSSTESFSEDDILLTRQAFGIDALSAGGLSVLVLLYIMIRTGFVSGLFYGITLFFSCIGYRTDSNYMKVYNNYQRRLSNSVSDSQLRFQYLLPIVWRFMEIIGIFAAVLDNHNDIIETLRDYKYGNFQLDVFVLAIVFNATYLVVLFFEFILYCCMRSRFNASQKQVKEVQEVEQLNGEKLGTEQAIVNNNNALPTEQVAQKLPEFIDEEAIDFNLRTSQL